MNITGTSTNMSGDDLTVTYKNVDINGTTDIDIVTPDLGISGTTKVDIVQTLNNKEVC